LPKRSEESRLQDPYTPSTAEITRIKKQTADVKTYTIHFLREQKEFSPMPGQFIMISVPGMGEAPFSLSSGLDKKGDFDTTVRNVGNITGYLNRCGTGARLGVRGSYGRSWPVKEAKGKDVLIVAGGIGLPPLRPVIMMIREDRKSYGNLEIFYGARTPADEVFTDEYAEWRRIPKTKLSLTVDSVPTGVMWPHKTGVVTGLFDDMETSPENSIVMTCGPEIMMRFVVRGLLARNFRKDQIYVSLERRMKCGMGHCGHCQMGAKFVCRDGPVFTYTDLEGLPDLTL
jgi:NAD(P)H-flavin reductase